MPALKVTIQTDDLHGDIARIKQHVDARLTKFYDAKITHAARLGAQYKEMVQALAKCHLAGGKRLRALLVVLGSDAISDGAADDLILVACAVEMLHAHLLIHDDVIDHDTRRHNMLNIAGLYARKFKRSAPEYAEDIGASMAILGGDLLLTYVYELIYETGLSADQKQLSTEALTTMMAEVMSGQMMDVSAQALKRRNEKDIMKLYRLKTASYSTIGPLILGARLAGKDDKTLKCLHDYGAAVGIAFQIRDDILPFEISAKVLGKSPLSDIREGKYTLLSHYALQFGSILQKQQWKKSYGNPNATMADWRAIKNVITQSGALAKVTSIAHDHIASAVKALGSAQLSPATKTRLEEFAKFSIERTR